MLAAGMDFRQPEYREEVFQRFYTFHLKQRSHPGCVYYLMPWLRAHFGWNDEEALWFAFLNGNTQHPLTSLRMHQAGSTPAKAMAVLEFHRAQYERLAFDTDRRHHKKAFGQAVAGYQAMVRRAGTQRSLWASAAADGWDAVWATARSIPTFGRLSAFSYCEYLRIMGIPVECTDLMIDDIPGSRSHRNGMCIVLGRDDLDWHPQSNPGFDGNYSPDTLQWLSAHAGRLLRDARKRNEGEDWSGDVGYFTMESALCTYKSWHRVNRRYPNVYQDMLYDRIRLVERQWGEDEVTEVFWRARAETQPEHLLLERVPGDPGCVPVKQNWYRLTGQVIMMDREWPEFANDFQRGVDTFRFGIRRDVMAAAAVRGSGAAA